MKKPYSVCDLPLESLLKIASYLSFSDLWYFGTSSRSCQKLAHQLVWHKYHIDLARQRINSFNHLIHASIAYVCRHGYDDQHDINHTAIQSVANRLAVEIYDRTPQLNWAPCLDFLLDKALGIMLDHVLYDPSLDPLPHQQHNQGGSSSSPSAEAAAVAEVAANSNDLPTMLSQGKKQKYASTPMGRLMTTLLVTLYPTLTALFDADPASAIHHRLLLAHISRHLDILTRRYHQQHRRRVSSGGSLSFARTESVRHGFRVLIQFIGNLCQTELMTAADLHILTRQRIIAFFISYQSTTNNNNTSTNINHHSDTNKKNNAANTTTTTSTTMTMLNPNNSNNDTSLKISSIQPQKTTTMVSTTDSSCWRLWMDEIEFQTAVLLDLLRAVVCRQYTRFDSGKELNMFASMLNETVSTLVSCKSSSPSSSPVSTSSSSSLPPTPPASSSTGSTSLSSSLSEPSVPKTTPPPSVAVVSAISPSR
ncbi:hypothetical protein INT45_003447 [Circinella minor]|uniref:F-box domain-containing protein n=1 Tax=Circinella minor TaxID=1195481 RepID=A0A8H7S927_9FUNG|nr:hypothetical protein INT45_003447 [Circinella minor]